jgi:hypothetical protein
MFLKKLGVDVHFQTIHLLSSQVEIKQIVSHQLDTDAFYLL